MVMPGPLMVMLSSGPMMNAVFPSELANPAGSVVRLLLSEIVPDTSLANEIVSTWWLAMAWLRQSRRSPCKGLASLLGATVLCRTMARRARDSSPAPKTWEWLASTCSTSVVPERGRPKTNTGRAVSSPCAAQRPGTLRREGGDQPIDEPGMLVGIVQLSAARRSSRAKALAGSRRAAASAWSPRPSATWARANSTSCRDHRGRMVCRAGQRTGRDQPLAAAARPTWPAAPAAAASRVDGLGLAITGFRRRPCGRLLLQ